MKNGVIERLHQEDLCQVLGCMPDQKYENEGGPGLSECCRVLEMYSSQPILDKQALVKWSIFNSEFLNFRIPALRIRRPQVERQ